jgi:hypothetical protein
VAAHFLVIDGARRRHHARRHRPSRIRRLHHRRNASRGSSSPCCSTCGRCPLATRRCRRSSDCSSPRASSKCYGCPRSCGRAHWSLPARRRTGYASRSPPPSPRPATAIPRPVRRRGACQRRGACRRWAGYLQCSACALDGCRTLPTSRAPGRATRGSSRHARRTGSPPGCSCS